MVKISTDDINGFVVLFQEVKEACDKAGVILLELEFGGIKINLGKK